MDEKGYSWPEAILTLAVLIVIFGTLLPLATKMTTTLYRKELTMHAAETAYQGVITYGAYGVSAGRRSYEGTDFDWEITENSICVTYLAFDKVAEKCVDN